MNLMPWNGFFILATVCISFKSTGPIKFCKKISIHGIELNCSNCENYLTKANVKEIKKYQDRRNKKQEGEILRGIG